MSSLGTLVPADLAVRFFKQMAWFLLVILFDITHTHTHTQRQTHTGHTGTNRLTHTYKDILTPPVICTQQLPILQ